MEEDPQNSAPSSVRTTTEAFKVSTHCLYIYTCMHTKFINQCFSCVLGGWECPIFHFLQSWQTWPATGKWKPSDDSWMGDSNVSLKWHERCHLSSKGLVFRTVGMLTATLGFFLRKKLLGLNCSNMFLHNQHLHWIYQKPGKLSCWLCTDRTRQHFLNFCKAINRFSTRSLEQMDWK